MAQDSDSAYSQVQSHTAGVTCELFRLIIVIAYEQCIPSVIQAQHVGYLQNF